MKTYKLTPLDQLELKEKQLREEIKISEQKMAFQLQYMKDNWGGVIAKSVTSSIWGKFFNNNNKQHAIESRSPYLTKYKGSGGGWTNFLLSNYKSVGSIGWRLLKPIAITFLTKKATSMLFSRKKRR